MVVVPDVVPSAAVGEAPVSVDPELDQEDLVGEAFLVVLGEVGGLLVVQVVLVVSVQVQEVQVVSVQVLEVQVVSVLALVVQVVFVLAVLGALVDVQLALDDHVAPCDQALALGPSCSEINNDKLQIIILEFNKKNKKKNTVYIPYHKWAKNDLHSKRTCILAHNMSTLVGHWSRQTNGKCQYNSSTHANIMAKQLATRFNKVSSTVENINDQGKVTYNDIYFQQNSLWPIFFLFLPEVGRTDWGRLDYTAIHTRPWSERMLTNTTGHDPDFLSHNTTSHTCHVYKISRF